MAPLNKTPLYKKPSHLETGDHIAIIASASPIDPYQIHAGLDVIRNSGLVPVLGDNLRFLRSTGFFAAPLEQRIAEFHQAWEDETIAALMVATGGFGCAQLLPYLNYNLIYSYPKPLVGFSDVTALNNALLAKAGIISFNGSTTSIRQNSEKNRNYDLLTLSETLRLLMFDGAWELKPFNLTSSFARCVFPGHACGPAVGGNLTTFACLLGTPFFPDVTNAILFLEDIDESSYEIARTLLHLKLAGVFEKVSGVVFGEFTHSSGKDVLHDPNVEDVIVGFFKEGPACVYGLNFSHCNTGPAVIPIGCMTTLDAENAIVSFENPFS